MARPRIFVSSTYYDLKHIRTSLDAFINSFGYEAILFEKGLITFHFDQSLDESCYNEIDGAHMFILIIGGNYGSPESKADIKPNDRREKMYLKYNSVTKKEHDRAREKSIPTYYFVEKGVLAEYDTFKQNRENDSVNYAHVDSKNIFYLLDDLYRLSRGNYICGFEKFDDIASWLRDQWAGLFADLLIKNRNQLQISDLNSKVEQVEHLSESLKVFTQEIMKNLKVNDADKIIKKEDEKIKVENAIRFTDEPLIRYLNNKYDLKLSPEKLLSAFLDSDNLDDFLMAIKLSSEQIATIMTDVGHVAVPDFNRYKRKYKKKVL